MSLAKVTTPATTRSPKKTEEHTKQRRKLKLGYLPLKKTNKNIQLHVVTFEPVSGRPRHIQGSAPFSEGASGGGLFDRHGRLVGILTFKSRSGGDFHFALPVEWVQEALSEQPSSTSDEALAFWQRTGEEQPYFLRAAACEANRNWQGLLAIAREWMRREPHSPEPWVAASKASVHLERSEEPASSSR